MEYLHIANRFQMTPFLTNSFDPLRLRREFHAFADTSSWRWRFAATLTMRQTKTVEGDSGRITLNLTEQIASQNFRHFLNVLNRAIFGSAAVRFGKGVRVIPVIEGGRDKRLHYHAAIECPRDELKATFPELVESCWKNTMWGYEEVRVTPDADEGWMRYMTKFRTKADFASAIDWMNYRN